MKKKGILHPELARIVAGMGHGDMLTVCDCGLPIPHGKPVANILLTFGIPPFADTLKVILEELRVERAIIATEMTKVNAPVYNQVKTLLEGIPIKKVSHENLKEISRTAGNISFVRTGEATKYANVILVAGVEF
jgi:D-ribose pyranase